MSDAIHQWIYVISPALDKGKNILYFAAYCKGCNTYFSEPVPVGDESVITKANLPRTGCDNSRAENIDYQDVFITK